MDVLGGQTVRHSGQQLKSPLLFCKKFKLLLKIGGRCPQTPKKLNVSCPSTIQSEPPIYSVRYRNLGFCPLGQLRQQKTDITKNIGGS